jgi:hypothetical protein
MPEIVIAHLVFLSNIDKLAKILGKQKVERPIKCYPDLLLPSWQLAQIDRAPHPPRQETGYIHAKDTGNTGAVSDRSELADGLKFEFPELSAVGIGDDVLRCNLPLSKSVLGRGRAELASGEIGNKRAIA